jgi:amidase
MCSRGETYPGTDIPLYNAHMNAKDQLALNRRDLFRAGVATAAFAISGCSRPQQTAPVSGAPAFELDEATIATLQVEMASGRFTARAIAEKYLERIEQIDKSGPAVNAVLEINPDTLAIAGALDEERKSKGARGPLHGVPVIIKDNIDTADRMATTAGSLALEGSIAPRDSFVAERLRAAGAVILGKANLSEWANFRARNSSSGWSGRGGQTRNPYALDRNPSGSSSGSAVAVAANLCAVAVGTETDGSIVGPSAVNGIVGIKPTVGLVSRAGIIPIAHSQDTAGPMARSVTDAAILLGALAGPDPRDPATAKAGGNLHTDYRHFLQPGRLRGARIGVARKFFGYHRDVDRLMDIALDVMKRQGAVLVDPADLPRSGFGGSGFEVLLYEFKAGLNAYLAGLDPKVQVRSLKEVIAFNEKNRDREMPYFGQETMLKAEEKGPLTDKAYLYALAKCRRLSQTEGIDAVMRKHNLDAIVAPAGGPAGLTDLILGDHDIGGSSSPAAVAGYPSITVPAGFVHGLPVGISFFGAAWSEPKLLRIAYSFEQASGSRRAPRFLTTADLHS